MKFGLQVIPGHEPAGQFIDFVKRAEDVGFEVIACADAFSLSSMRSRDVYTSLTLVAEHTKTALVGPCVTNLITRHLYVTVNALCSLDDVAGGRAWLGLGTGDSPVYLVGKRMSRMAELQAGVQTIQALCAGKPATWEGKELSPGWKKPHIPVFVAADGPKMLQMGGEVADGVVLGAGVTPEVIRWARGHVEEGAERAGRKEKVPIWFNAICHFEADGDAARRRIRPRLGTRMNHNFRVGYFAVPPERVEEVKRFRENYNEDDVGEATRNAEFMTDYLVDRFAIAGTVAEGVERFEKLAEVGAETFITAMPFEFEARRRLIDAFAKEIIPRFQS